MTTREFYNLVLETTKDFDYTTLNDEQISKMNLLTEKAIDLLAKLDEKNEKRKSSDSKQKKESAGRRNDVLSFLHDNEGWHSRDEIGVECGITEGQATSACSALLKEGLITKSTIKIEKAKKVVYAYGNVPTEE